MITRIYIAGLLVALMSNSVWASVADDYASDSYGAKKRITRIAVLASVTSFEQSQLTCSQVQSAVYGASFFPVPNISSAPIIADGLLDIAHNWDVGTKIAIESTPSEDFNSTLPGPPAGPPPKHLI